MHQEQAPAHGTGLVRMKREVEFTLKTSTPRMGGAQSMRMANHTAQLTPPPGREPMVVTLSLFPLCGE